MTSPVGIKAKLTPTKIALKATTKLRRENAPVLEVHALRVPESQDVLLTIVIDAARRHELDVTVLERVIDEVSLLAERPLRYTISGRRT